MSDERAQVHVSANRIEHFAALTLTIVLLREQVRSESTPQNRRAVVMQELDRLEKKRAELEEIFETRTGGS
jgi:hypothetical protein